MCKSAGKARAGATGVRESAGGPGHGQRLACRRRTSASSAERNARKASPAEASRDAGLASRTVPVGGSRLTLIGPHSDTDGYAPARAAMPAGAGRRCAGWWRRGQAEPTWQAGRQAWFGRQVGVARGGRAGSAASCACHAAMAGRLGAWSWVYLPDAVHRLDAASTTSFRDWLPPRQVGHSRCRALPPGRAGVTTEVGPGVGRMPTSRRRGPAAVAHRAPRGQTARFFSRRRLPRFLVSPQPERSATSP